MDGYITKPVRAKELFETIDRLAAGPPAATVPEPPAEAVGIDWSAALEYVGGDEHMLRDLIGIFLVEAPRWLSELREAVARGRAADVKRLAHNLKGSLRLFGAKSVIDSSFLLEQMGRSGNLSGAAEACAALQTNIEQLMPILRQAGSTMNAEA